MDNKLFKMLSRLKMPKNNISIKVIQIQINLLKKK